MTRDAEANEPDAKEPPLERRRRRRLKRLAWLMGGLGLLAAAAMFVNIAGLVVVRDTTGQVVSAVVTDGYQVQPLHHVRRGLFVTIPRMEGVVEIRCRDGSINQHGQVHAYMHTRVKVVGELPCRHMLDG